MPTESAAKLIVEAFPGPPLTDEQLKYLKHHLQIIDDSLATNQQVIEKLLDTLKSLGHDVRAEADRRHADL